MLNMKKTLFILIYIIAFGSVKAQTPLIESFKNPTFEAKPWTFWYWMRGSVSKSGIKADLEAMKEIGLGGAYLMPIRGIEDADYTNSVEQLTPEWWEMVRYSFQMADSLGLKMGMHISDGFALAGGPWIKPEESMQKVVFTDTIVKGGKIRNLHLAQPEKIENYYKEIAVFAMGIDKALTEEIQKEDWNDFMISSNNPDDSHPFSEAGKAFRATQPCYIQYEFKTDVTLRSIVIEPAGNNIQSQRLLVLYSFDGINYAEIKQLTPPRQGWQNYGFNTTFSVSATKARYFRLSWTPDGTEPGSEELDAAKWKPTLKINASRLSPESRINSWEGKSGLVWRIAEATKKNEAKICTPAHKVINLTKYLKNGVLNCKLPKGSWRIVRMGHTSTGMTNATGGGGKGLECDKFSEKAVQKQFDGWFGAAFTKTDNALARRVLKYMHIDSWECGSQNWSDNFPAEFEKRRGYDLMPYLPLMAGFPIENIEKSEHILRDVRTTIAELVDDVFFKVMVSNAKKLGCEVSAESVAPTMVSDGLLHYKEVDFPMGEFWLNSPTHDKPNDMIDAISAGHIYGKNIIQSESFTQLRTNWNEDPAMLKPLLDRNLALGINRIFFHIFVHNPYTNKAPGMTLDGIGLYFQRNQTWWKQGKAFVDYIARCQTLLQYGHPVTDIAVYTGDEVPRRSLTPDKLVPLLPGIVGQQRVESERIRLANIGQPMCEMPAGVNHSANILKAENWVNPLNGYAYDSFNQDALLRLAKVKDGYLQFGDGTNYQVVIFPNEKSYDAATIAKIEALRKAGMYTPQLPYQSARFSFEPDVMAPENIAWTHRSGKQGEVYFISNQEDQKRNISISFRVADLIPQIWNPVNAEIYSPTSWRKKGNCIEVELELPANGSLFVVFAKTATQTKTVEHFKNSENLSVNGNWTVSFEKINQTLTVDSLFDWSISDNPKIKYYSGTAVYNNTFNYKIKAHPIMLDLGKVCNLATVKINGIDCGTVWTSPYALDITKALKSGKNSVSIEVTNTWANAILGSDRGTPPFDGIWTNGKYRMKENKLMEAGLIGPIKIEY